MSIEYLLSIYFLYLSLTKNKLENVHLDALKKKKIAFCVN